MMHLRPEMIVLNWRIRCLTFDPCRQRVKTPLVYVHIVTSANEDVTHETVTLLHQRVRDLMITKSCGAENISSQLMVTAEAAHVIRREINITTNILLVKL